MGERNEREGTRVVVGEWKELVPATEPRDFHILQTLSTSELHLRSWKSLIYPLPIYLCFLNLLQETYCFHSYKKKNGCYFQYLYATFSGWGLPWTTACGAICVLLFFLNHIILFSVISPSWVYGKKEGLDSSLVYCLPFLTTHRLWVCPGSW